MTEQEKREKVISDLELQIAWIRDNDFHKFPGWGHSVLAMRDALTLLKAQEPVEPILKREGWNKYFNYYVCPICNQELTYEQCYCSECGRAVKWDD